MEHNEYPNFAALFWRRPDAHAKVLGSGEYPEIAGTVRFYRTRYGTFVITEMKGLPTDSGSCKGEMFGCHVHGGGACSGNENDPFANAGQHYNPLECPHPYHAGDLPPLFGADGYAYAAFLTNRFTVKEIVGKTVVIHSQPDDFTSQPAGNSGRKIACGEIFGK